MDRDNVTSIEAHKLADLMMQEWVSSYSDSGALWERDYNALQVIKSEAGDEIVEEAYQLAKARWDKMHGR
jgi:hypothetical protein